MIHYNKELVTTILSDCLPKCLKNLSDFCYNEWEMEFNVDLPRGWYQKDGATKMVFVNEDYNYVIKIPYFGVDYEKFENAIAPIEQMNQWDYCKREMELYALARSEGLGRFFAATYQIGEFMDYPIYIQEKCTPFGRFHSKDASIISQSVEYLKEMNVRHNPFDAKFVVDMVQKEGFDKVQQFYEFLKKYQIDDLHTGNYGYRNELPKIIDYSGFNG